MVLANTLVKLTVDKGRIMHRRSKHMDVGFRETLKGVGGGREGQSGG